MTVPFFGEKSLLCTPRFELLHGSVDDEQGIIKRLPYNYQQDKSQIDRFLEESRLVRERSGYCLAFTQSVVGDKGPTFHARLDPVLTVYQLCRRGIRYRMPLPLSAGFRLLEQLVPVLEEHQRADSDTDAPSLSWPEYNPGGVLVHGDRLWITHLNIGLPPALNSTLYRSEDRTYLDCVAPEQCIAGRRPALNSHLFTLGHLVFQLLTGNGVNSLWQNAPMDVILSRKARLVHPFVSDIRPGLALADELVMNLLQPLPERRVFDLARFLGLLETMASLETVKSGPSINEYHEMLADHAAKRDSALHAGAKLDELSQSFDIAQLNDS
jgi:hypothetical protein